MAGELVSIRTEIWYDAAWNDISADARAAMPVRITGGVANEGGAASSGSMTMQINNGRSKVEPTVVGRYSTRNPLSDLYGKIGRNTPIRVSARLGAVGAWSVRAVTEVAAWPKTWGKAGEADSWVTLQTAGILQRIGQGDPLQSPMRRAQRFDAPSAVWPMEDGERATFAGSGLDGGSPLTISAAGPVGGAEMVAVGSADGHTRGRRY
jgi:hypothetical protein